MPNPYCKHSRLNEPYYNQIIWGFANLHTPQGFQKYLTTRHPEVKISRQTVTRSFLYLGDYVFSSPRLSFWDFSTGNWPSAVAYLWQGIYPEKGDFGPEYPGANDTLKLLHSNQLGVIYQALRDRSRSAKGLTLERSCSHMGALALRFLAGKNIKESGGDVFDANAVVLEAYELLKNALLLDPLDPTKVESVRLKRKGANVVARLYEGNNLISERTFPLEF